MEHSLSHTFKFETQDLFEASETEIQNEMQKLVLKEPLELEHKTRIYESRLYNQIKEHAIEIEVAYLSFTIEVLRFCIIHKNTRASSFLV